MKNRFLKFAKEIVRIGGWISKHGNQSEIRDACDPEVKDLIRAKRNKKVVDKIDRMRYYNQADPILKVILI